jgi:hypothetical protein
VCGTLAWPMICGLWKRARKSHLNNDETSTGAVCGSEVDARLVVRDVEALDGRQSAIGEAK